MASGTAVGEEQPVQDQQVASAQEICSLLRLLGAGASGSILLALGEGPLRTKDLTTQVSGYAPRTVYRYVGRLAEIGALEREEEPGVPSKVVHSLIDPCGVDLHDLVKLYARTARSLQRLADGRVVSHSWGSLTLLADLWDSGMFRAMNAGSRTATELARVDHDFSFHQVSRRTSLFMIGGMIREAEPVDRRRRYELTPEARQASALIAGLAQWRERYGGSGEAGLTPEETAELVRAALPLVGLPEHSGKRIRLTVAPEAEGNGSEGESVWAEVGEDGGLSPCEAKDEDAWARGSVREWTGTLTGSVDVRAGGRERALARACLAAMAAELWPPEAAVPVAAA
jgi:DNA-binding HxlR family transcriptional regulator